MSKQSIKLECNGNKFFNTSLPYNTAHQQAMRFIKRNKDIEIKLFISNISSFGEKWVLFKTYNKK